MAPAAATSPEALAAFIRDRMESARVPGLALAIIRDGKLLSLEGFGYANIAQRRAMQAGTLINVASLTKTATCLAVMQLREQDKFDLDDDVNAYLPFPVRNPLHPQLPITFRQLLTHTSSIVDGPDYGGSYACGDSRVALGPWLRDYLGNEGNFHRGEPGGQFQYSNVAYGLLGHLIETLSSMTYAEYMRKAVFAPLRMPHTRFALAGMDPQLHATPYTFAKDGDFDAVRLRDPAWVPPENARDGVQVPHCLYSFATPPDGLARTSAEEWSRLLRAFANGGELDGARVLRSETVAEILADQQVAFKDDQGSTPGFRQGLAWRRFDDPEVGVVWRHTGGDPGVATLMSFRPEDRLGVVVLTNSAGGHGIAAEIARRVFNAA